MLNTPRSIEDRQEKTEDDIYTAANEALVLERQDTLKKNIALEKYEMYGEREDTVMSNESLFMILENMMDKKLIADKKCLEISKRPTSISEYLLEYLNEEYGTRKTALKQLSRIVPSLHTLYKKSHPYANFFSRFLQMFHQDPIPYQLSVFITRIRAEFHELIDIRQQIEALDD